MAQKKEYHHITRLDYGATHGWWVRIRRRGFTHSKLFSDGVWKGKKKALTAAIAWRDELLEKAPRKPQLKTESRNKGIKTGVTGLSLLYTQGRKGQLPHLQVSVQQNHRHIGRRYSVRKWGLRGALWKACVEIARSRHESAKENADRQQVQKTALELYNRAYKPLAEALGEKMESALPAEAAEAMA